MKMCIRSSLPAAVIIGMAAFTTPAVKAAANDASASKRARTPVNIRAVVDVPIPQATFTVPNQPNEGRNPFFPQSVIKVVAPRITKETPIDTTLFILNGITSPPRATAMINGRTFEQGEEGEVKLVTGGKQLIKCEEIKTESAIILVGGQRRELRLRSGL